MTKLYHSCGGFILVRTFEDCAEYVYFSNSEKQVLRVGVFTNAELEKYKYPTKELRTCMAAFEENRLFSTAAEVSLAMTKEMPYLGYIREVIPVEEIPKQNIHIINDGRNRSFLLLPGTYLTVARGSSLSTAQCEYIDEAHFKWGDGYYHTEQFANMLKNCKAVCYPEHVHIESELAISCGTLYFTLCKKQDMYVGAVFNTKYQKLEEFRFSRNHFTSNEALYSMLKQREMEKCLFAWETYTDIEKKATACKQPLTRYRCPKCGGTSFGAAAHIVQEWQLDEFGKHVRCINNCVAITCAPSETDYWDCLKCGCSLPCVDFHIAEEAYQKSREDLKQWLVEQDVSAEEADEVLNRFSDNITKEDLTIVRIYESAEELGESYIANVVCDLDHHVAAVLDTPALGEEIADTCDEYLKLKNGRIIQFEL